MDVEQRVDLLEVWDLAVLSILARFLSEGDGRSDREGIVGAGHEVERVAAISFFGLGSTTKQGELTSFSRPILVHQLQGGYRVAHRSS